MFNSSQARDTRPIAGLRQVQALVSFVADSRVISQQTIRFKAEVLPPHCRHCSGADVQANYFSPQLFTLCGNFLESAQGKPSTAKRRMNGPAREFHDVPVVGRGIWREYKLTHYRAIFFGNQHMAVASLHVCP